MDRAFGACLSLLVAAIAVYVAVRLIEAVWVVLVVITCAVGLVFAATALYRQRNRGW